MVLSEWQVDNKIVACVTDNAANMVKAVQLAKWWHVPCFAHSLNLIVQSSLIEITDTLSKVKSIVEFFKRSTSAMEKLQNVQQRMGASVLKLKQDCPTRWNSTSDMLRRFSKNKESLQSTLGILNNPTLPVLSPEDWYIIETCSDILIIFEEITVEISAEKNVSLSKIAILSKNLISYCSRLKSETFENGFVINMVNKLYDEVGKRFKWKYRNITIIWEATFLDPRFKQHGFHEDDIFKQTKENVIKKCMQIREREKDKLQKNTTDESRTISTPTLSTSSKKSSRFGDIWTEFDSTVGTMIEKTDNSMAAAIIEVDKYLQMPLISRKADPLLWWKENKNLFPSLSDLMKRRLCIPATSVPCERIFSKSGQIITERRNRLSAEKSSKIIFLNSYFNSFIMNSEK
ncbi:unnamed protein product [Acanthoscelides obtectus]|uniref:HAT C-terminal dimerisation domain-containing protein n=1 Tax=Acanthoscelides obtectus TaxID=200917 RepID=A0A9P0JQQ9_ACAOB|nr:unnamed protein product [Acanthoscelides obtectus]CAK1661868.1 Zinc finger BED domain-containing protein 1 [Acanthoscelides obtectus]